MKVTEQAIKLGTHQSSLRPLCEVAISSSTKPRPVSLRAALVKSGTLIARPLIESGDFAFDPAPVLPLNTIKLLSTFVMLKLC